MSFYYCPAVLLVYQVFFFFFFPLSQSQTLRLSFLLVYISDMSLDSRTFFLLQSVFRRYTTKEFGQNVIVLLYFPTSMWKLDPRKTLHMIDYRVLCSMEIL